MTIKQTLAATGLLAIGFHSSHSLAVEMINNGDFETGDLSGWTEVDPTDLPGCSADWYADTTGSVCRTVGGGTPGEGRYSAYNALDGFGPTEFRMIQSISVPANVETATLSWIHAYEATYRGDPRSFNVEITDAADSTVHAQVFELVFTGSDSAPWTPVSEDISTLLQAHEGETVNVAFTTVIPEDHTGPAGFGLDSVSLDIVAGPAEPPAPIPTLSTLGLGMLAGAIGLLGAFYRRRV